MSKKILHLICNSHLDPVWQWDWDEGASSALATFYAACNLLDKYDFIFCHNEVLLYEYIERYDPQLFLRISDLVHKGKWKIMGGWYVQPDCLVPSGESFIRQCSLGREYFADRFNARPTTAINFDAFGHTRGIADVLASCGYDSYIFCRPMEWLTNITVKPVPHGPFLWKGYSGKKVKALRFEDLHIYCSSYGKAKESILSKESHYQDLDIAPILWGVGNHGGISSEKDLEDIMVLKDEKKGEWEIIHSCLEDYFAAVNPTTMYSQQMIAFIKSYTSVNAIKLAHDQLENALYLSEKICSVADIQRLYTYNKEVFKSAEQVLCQIEFHDVLSGTAIKSGTMSSIMKAHSAIDSLRKEMYAAFVALAKHLPKVTPRHDNFVILNPYPYEYNGYVELEFFLEEGMGDRIHEYKKIVYDMDGNEVPSQNTKEESEIRIDRRERMLFKVSIPPFSVKSYGCKVELIDIVPKTFDETNDIVVKDEYKSVTISRETGLLTSYIVNGKEYIKEGAFVPTSFDDNDDPWGWHIKTLHNNLRSFKVDKSSKGLFEGLAGVTIVEEGPLLTQVEALFTKGESHIVIDYKLYKGVPYIDVKLHVIWNDKRKGLKLKLPLDTNLKYFAQMAFGIENYSANTHEYPCNRYVGSFKDKEAFVIYNKSGIHGVSKKGRNLYLTLFNGAAYCAHPTGPLGEQILPDLRRYTESIEVGTHDFEFRVCVNKLEECERISNEFNQPLYGVQFFPHSESNNLSFDSPVTLSNPNVVITAFKRRNDDTYLIRLYNGSNSSTSTTLTILKAHKKVNLKAFEFKTLVYSNRFIVESSDSSIY